jgi:Secretion system C-terminal sorting domain
MKIQLVSTIFALFMGSLVTSSYKKDPNNPPVASTGAPNEQTCNYSGCHTAGTYTGTVAMSGVPDSVVAGQTYTVTMTVASATALRSGFQMTCLNSNNAACGTFTTATGVSIGTGTGATAGRQYPRQATPKNFAAGTVSWTYPWKAPSSLTNNKITFYYVGMAANSDGKERLDNSFSGSKVVYLKTGTTPTADVDTDLSVTIFPNPTQELLYVDVLGSANTKVTLFDIQGRMVLNTVILAKNSSVNIKHLSRGTYTARIETADKKVSKKVIIQ